MSLLHVAESDGGEYRTSRRYTPTVVYSLLFYLLSFTFSLCPSSYPRPFLIVVAGCFCRAVSPRPRETRTESQSKSLFPPSRISESLPLSPRPSSGPLESLPSWFYNHSPPLRLLVVSHSSTTHTSPLSRGFPSYLYFFPKNSIHGLSVLLRFASLIYFFPSFFFPSIDCIGAWSISHL